MSRLKERLSRLGRGDPVPECANDREDRTGALRNRLDRILGAGRVVPATQIAPLPSARHPVEKFVEGRRVFASGGPVFVSEWVAPPLHRHGRLRVADLLDLGRAGPRELFPEHFRDVARPQEMAFLDTETTGLAGGAGTIPFMVGIGRWRSDHEPGGFRVVQLFLEDLDREEALLEVLGRELEGVRCLVTYNGLSYDLPILENRHVLNRRAWPLSGTAHLDLLHPARTLWRHGHADCRLTTLERSVLGFSREGDIPGSEIPALYNLYLRRGATRRMAAVFRHNRYDLLSLAGLLWAAGQAPYGGTTGVGVGLLHARNGRYEKARPALEASLEEDLPRGLRWAALRQLSLVLKREGQWEQALGIWEEMRALNRADPFAVTEAAKVLEHRLGDARSALRLVEQALASASWCPRDRQDLERRRARLARKAGRSFSRAG